MMFIRVKVDEGLGGALGLSKPGQREWSIPRRSRMGDCIGDDAASLPATYQMRHPRKSAEPGWAPLAVGPGLASSPWALSRAGRSGPFDCGPQIQSSDAPRWSIGVRSEPSLPPPALRWRPPAARSRSRPGRDLALPVEIEPGRRERPCELHSGMPSPDAMATPMNSKILDNFARTTDQIYFLEEL